MWFFNSSNFSGDSKNLFDQIDQYIARFFEDYIRIYDPGFTVEEVMGSILDTYLEDDKITIRFINPYSHLEEELSFAYTDVVDNTQKEIEARAARALEERIPWESTAFDVCDVTDEMFAIVHSWKSEIKRESIISIAPRFFNLGTANENSSNDMLVVLYYWSEWEVIQERCANCIKGENDGIRWSIDRYFWERERIMKLLTSKRPRK